MTVLDYSIFITSKIQLSFLGNIKTDFKDNISYFLYTEWLCQQLQLISMIFDQIYMHAKDFFANNDFILQQCIRYIIFCRKVHFKYVLIHTCSKIFSLKKKLGIDVHGYKEVVMTFLYSGFDFCVIELITIRVTVCISYVIIFGFCYNYYNKPTS